jgi:glycosyltransferase involved in cell wall biosynthesis
MRSLSEVIDRSAPAIALVHDEMTADAVRLRLSRRDLPWVVVVHGVNRNQRMLNGAGRRLLHRVYSNAAAIVRVGSGVAVQGPYENKTHLIPNGARRLRSTKGIVRDADFIVLSVSGLREGKGVEDNLAALARLRKDGRDVTYRVAGDGPLRIALENEARRLGVADRTSFLGWVPRDQLGDELAACDLFSLPSSPEANGIAYVEAMLHSKPVIACRGEGPESFVHDRENGVLVQKGDGDALARAWKRFADDATFRQELGARAALDAVNLTWEANAESIETLLSGLQMESPAGRVLWMAVEPTDYLRASIAAASSRMGRHITVAYLAGGGAASWGHVCRLITLRRGAVLMLEGWADLRFLIAMFLARMRRVPYIVASDTFRESPEGTRATRSALKGLIVVPLLRRAAVLFPGGTPQARYVKALVGRGQRPILIAHMTVDDTVFTKTADIIGSEARAAQRASWGADDADVVVLFVGRLEPEKGIDVLVGAVDQLRNTRVLLVLYGTGSLESKLAERANNPSIHLAGQALQSDLAEAYASADIFVLPSLFEPWGLVVNEAMAAGLPCVVSDAVGAAEDLVTDGTSGLIVPAGNADALAHAIGDLAADPDLRHRLGAAGRARMQDWSLDVYAESVKRAVDMAEDSGRG